MGLEKDIPELIKAGIITPEVAEGIQQYYKNRNGSSTSRLFLAFGILGAILVGLGIILIIAHNWDQLSKPTKTVFAFFPLIVAQVISAYVLLKRMSNKTWIESTSTFLIFAVGACLSLVSQIYHISGNLQSFLLIWMLLILPVIYLMNSSMAAILYLCGITLYAVESGYNYPFDSNIYFYWLLLLAIFPHYYLLLKNNRQSNFLNIENWLIPLSITLVLGTIVSTAQSLLFVAYFSLFGLFYSIGNTPLFKERNLRNNPYKVVGELGILILLYITSFDGFWKEMQMDSPRLRNYFTAPEFWASIIITTLTLLLFYQQQKLKPLWKVPPLSPIFILFILVFALGYFTTISVILINLIILAVGIITIFQGAEKEHLGILNFGLSIITVWIIIRFLNTDLSFVIRGLILIIIGIGFFMANYLMLKKRRKDGK